VSVWWLGLAGPLALAWAWGHTPWLDPLSFVSLQGVFATWAWLWLPLARRDGSDDRPLERGLASAGLAAWLWALGWALDAAHGREPWPWPIVLGGCLGLGALGALSAAAPRRRAAWAGLHLASVMVPCALATARWAGRPALAETETAHAPLSDWFGPAVWTFEAWFDPAAAPSTAAIWVWIALPAICWALPGGGGASQGDECEGSFGGG
jgi:hypothetical protein